MFNIKQGIMKRVLNYRTILAVALMFATAGLFAQTPIPGWDNGAGGDNYESVGVTYVTEGKTIPLYAEPDAYYHPSYDPATGTGLTVGFTWNWSSADEPVNISFGGAADNYLEVTGVNAGSYTVNVQEVAPWGGCSDVGQNITINVVTEPAMTFAAGSVTTEDCEGGTFPAAIQTAISGGYQFFRITWSLEIKTLTPLGADDDWYDTDKTTVLAPGGLAEEYTQAVPEAVAASGNHDITSIAGGFTVINAQTTVYTYTLNGLNDVASRWGDFLTLAAGAGVNGAAPDDFMYYDTVAESVVITVHPTPTTGPIFHIDGTWAN
jgi:hypothetical protein